MDSEIFVKLSDDDFRVTAFAEYCTRAQERYTNLVNAFTMLPSSYDEDITEMPDDADIEAIVDDVMQTCDIGTSVVSLDEGYISTKELLTLCVKDMISADITSEDTTKTSYSQTIIADLKDATGSVTHTTNLSLADIGDSLQSQLHSITCLAAGAQAFSEAKGIAANAITIFNDKVRDVFKDANADISSTAQYVKALLADNNPCNFVKGCIEKIGINKQANATSEEDVLPLDNDMAQYTGVSPAGPLNFSSALSAVTTIAKSAATVVSGISKGLANVVGALFKKGVNFLSETLVNPNDLETINDKGFNTVNGFQFQTSWQVNLSYGQIDQQIAEKYQDKWIAMKTRFGEWCVRITSVNATTYSFESLFKPRVINFSAMNSVLIDGTNSPTVTYSDLADILDKTSALGDSLYNVSGLTERDVYRGLLMSIELEARFIYYGYAQLKGDDESSIISSLFYKKSPGNYGTIPSTITNLDWVKAFSGWDENYKLFVGGVPYYLFDPSFSGSLRQGQYIVEAFLTVMQFERDYPGVESPFVPFSNNHTSFNEPSFRIKTDAENQDAFNKFVTTAIIVTVVAAVAITSVVLVKKFIRAKYFKRAQRVGELDNKMWSGKSLTGAEQRAYVRAKRRMDRSSLFASSLVNPISSQNNSSNCDYNNNILSYIVDVQ